MAINNSDYVVGASYDFNFDFVSDAAMVCTEVVYKAYQSGPEMTGLDLPLTKTMGRMVTPANEIARMFDAEFGKDGQQLDLIHFLDGVERISFDQFCTVHIQSIDLLLSDVKWLDYASTS